jgi:hypothetical protein
MEYIYKLRDEMMELKKMGTTEFKIPTGDTNFNIDKFIEEIDGLRLCKCPTPKV